MLADLKVAFGALHHGAPPTVGRVPWTERGACRLAEHLADVDEPVEQPVTVWWWDERVGEVRRGSLYGWRGAGASREALVVARYDACPLGDDCVRWVPAGLTNPRRE